MTSDTSDTRSIQCPLCGTAVKLRKDGTMPTHDIGVRADCSGSGLTPEIAVSNASAYHGDIDGDFDY